MKPLFRLAAISACLLLSGIFAAHAQDFARIDLSLGVFMPSGEYSMPGYKSLPYDTGFAFGLGLTHYINENIGVGVFLDGNYMGAEKQYDEDTYGKINISSSIAGGYLQLQTPISSKLYIFGSAKLGKSSNSINVKMKTRSQSYSLASKGYDSSVAFILEGGLRYAISSYFDMGALLKYTSNKQKFAGEGFDSELGGTTLSVRLGFKLL